MAENLKEKIPPQSIDAEKSVLGCLILDKEAIYKIVDFLSPEDFYKRNHGEIYRAAQDLYYKGEPIDLLSISNRLKEKNSLEEIGGAGYLTELVNFVATPAHVLSYAKIVRQKKILRELINASHKIEELGYREEENTDFILDEAEKRIFEIAQKGLLQEFTVIKETLKDARERIERLMSDQKSLRGVPTGFMDMDNLLAGFQKSNLIILAARPSFGKSSLALNIAANVAISEKIPVGVFSLEMSKEQVVDRLIASVSGVDLWKIMTGKLKKEGPENDIEKIDRTMEILKESPIYIDDASSPNILQIKAMCRRLQAQKGLGLVIIDYLQLMAPLNTEGGLVQQVSENSRGLKALARELNVPVLVLSQLSRAVEQRTPSIPRLADLRQSGSIEQDADIVMFIYREDRYREESANPGITDIIVAKHRNGPIGKFSLYFDERTVTFKNLEKNVFLNEEAQQEETDEI